MTPYQILIRPVLTEKTTTLAEDGNKIVFRVHRGATKFQIRNAIEKIFGVKVEKVNTMVIAGKPKRVGRSVGRRAGYKKAIITLAAGQMVDFYALENLESEADAG